MAKPPPPTSPPSRKAADPPPPPPPPKAANPFLLQRVTLKLVRADGSGAEARWVQPPTGNNGQLAELLSDTYTPTAAYVREMAMKGGVPMDIASITLEAENGLRTKSKTWTGGPLATLLASPLTVASLVKLVQSSL